jgi:hypothetical protein
MTVRVTKDNGVVQVETDAAKDMVDKPRFAFMFKSVWLLTDRETGIETTAPVLIEEDTSIARPKKGQKPASLPKAAQTALRALREAVNEVGAVPQASNHIPANVRVVSFDQWRTYAYKMGISAGGERAERAAFQRSSEHLIGAQFVGAWNQQAWCRSEEQPAAS